MNFNVGNQSLNGAVLPPRAICCRPIPVVIVLPTAKSLGRRWNKQRPLFRRDGRSPIIGTL